MHTNAHAEAVLEICAEHRLRFCCTVHVSSYDGTGSSAMQCFLPTTGFRNSAQALGFNSHATRQALLLDSVRRTAGTIMSDSTLLRFRLSDTPGRHPSSHPRHAASTAGSTRQSRVSGTSWGIKRPHVCGINFPHINAAASLADGKAEAKLVVLLPVVDLARQQEIDALVQPLLQQRRHLCHTRREVANTSK